MKKYLLMFCLALIALAGCQPEEAPKPKGKEDDEEITEVRLNKTKLELTEGDSEKLTATVLPEELSGTKVEWKSSDDTVATVAADGTVTAVAIGAATVTAEAGGRMAACTVIVSLREVDEVVVEPAAVTNLQVGNTIQLAATILPNDVKDKTVTWSSSDDKIVTVDSEGMITAIAKGSATIIAKAGNEGGTCDVTVIGRVVDSVTIEQESVEMESGDTMKLNATVLPEHADDKTVAWSSSDESVATVDQDGTVTAESAGEAVITARSGDKSDTCNIVVSATPRVGDFYYSDGTFSPTLNPNKTVIGVIFWTGDATAQDATLKADHPDCVNGLVVALDGEAQSAWQSNAGEYNREVSPWITANTRFKGVKVIGGGGDGDPLLNTIAGYNNTLALEAFNAAPENSSWPVEAVEGLPAYRTDVPAPDSSSDWYLPSPKELSLLCSGEYASNIWDIFSDYDNRDFINNRLSMVEDAQLLGKAYYPLYLSSSEIVATKFAGILFSAGTSTPLWLKEYGGLEKYMGAVRYILAF